MSPLGAAPDAARKAASVRGLSAYVSNPRVSLLLAIVVRQPPPPADPWLRAMFNEVFDRMQAMIEGRGDGEFSPDEAARWWALVCELTDIQQAMREARSRP